MSAAVAINKARKTMKIDDSNETLNKINPGTELSPVISFLLHAHSPGETERHTHTHREIERQREKGRKSQVLSIASAA